jgi:hypothetical protein
LRQWLPNKLHLHLKGDIADWQWKTSNYPLQSVSLFWRFSVSHVNIHGRSKGIIDDLGQIYRNALVTKNAFLRPICSAQTGFIDAPSPA